MSSKVKFSNALVLFLCSLTSSFALSVAKAEDKNIQAASAVDLMRSAHEGRAMWDRFPGFKAKVQATTDTESLSGTLEVDAEGTMKLTMDGGAKAEWAERTLGSVVSHRRSTSEFESAVEFADQNLSHPLGRLIKSTTPSEKSHWRVKDDVLTEVHRSTPTSHFVISVSEVWRNPAGKHLPRTFTVTTWDDASKTLKSTRQVVNEWKRVGDYDLPTKLQAINCAADGSRKVEQIELTGHELLSPAAAVSAAR